MTQSYLKKTAILAIALSIGMTAHADSIRFWTTETQPDRLAKQQQMARDFQAATGTAVKVIPVEEKDYNQRVTAAFAAGDLPDVIYHPLQYALPWVDAGVLDTDASSEIIDDLSAESFAAGTLNMVATDSGYAAVPVDGWTQIVVYRKDLFEKYGLATPNSYANIVAAIKKLHNPPKMFGFVAPTKVDESFMSQVLEHILLANGISPVDKNGFKPLDKRKTIEALEFYKTIASASPQGELYWKQSRELYFAGKAAIIMWSPFILDELAGLRDNAPPTINSNPQSRQLASKTGIVTKLAGPSNPSGATWADIRYFGVTSDADTGDAIDFIKYSMNEGYMNTLSIAPEGKFPARRGDGINATIFADAWSKLPVGVDRKAPLSDIYPQATIAEIVSGLDTANRWGVVEGQLSLASKIINSQVINRYFREYFDGVRTAEATHKALNNALAKIK